MDTIASTVRFGECSLDLQTGVLEAAGEVVRLQRRHLIFLVALLESPGTIVSNDVLMDRLWPGERVDPSSLQAQAAFLRWALGVKRELLQTHPGRGYSIAAERCEWDATRLVNPTQPPHWAPTDAPQSIGRSSEISSVLRLLGVVRAITLCGTAGVGKTNLAREIVRIYGGSFEDGAIFVDFERLEPHQVPQALATALGFQLYSRVEYDDWLPGIAGAKRLLIVLDTCDRVREAAESAAAAILKMCPGISIIAASVERLDFGGETFLVDGLGLPSSDSKLEDVLASGAVQLFTERARLAGAAECVAIDELSVIARICRRLGGLPLAIEVAAARANSLGLHRLDRLLEERMPLSVRQEALEELRESILSATLDWSYELLDDAERTTFTRLAIFRGSFSLDSAIDVTTFGPFALDDIPSAIATLVQKALLVVTTTSSATRYEFHSAIRDFARQQHCSQENQLLSIQHMRHFARRAYRAAQSWNRVPTATWVERERGDIEEIRAALEFAFGTGGHPDVGVQLAIHSLPLFVELAMLADCHRYMDLSAKWMKEVGFADDALVMEVNACFGTVLFRLDPRSDQGRIALERALSIAEATGNNDVVMSALWGLWMHSTRVGAQRAGLSYARAFCRAAEDAPEPMDQVMGNQLVGTSLLLIGDLPAALFLLDMFRLEYAPPIKRSHLVRFAFDQTTLGAVTCALGHWLAGRPRKAATITHESLEYAARSGASFSYCITLVLGGCAIALLNGELDAAHAYADEFQTRARSHGLEGYLGWATTIKFLVSIREGLVPDVAQLSEILSEIRQRQQLRGVSVHGELVEAIGLLQGNQAALEFIDQEIHRLSVEDERWCLPEALRVKAKLMANAGSEAIDVRELLTESIDMARIQGALSWELRSSISLAEQELDFNEAALNQLQQVLLRMEPGAWNQDIGRAEELLRKR